MINNYIGYTLKKIRILRGLSQRKLEEKTGIHNRLLQMYESGKRIPKNENLQKIAHALGVDIYALKEIDISPDQKSSLRQLLFQLEKKGLFGIENIELHKLESEHGRYSATIRIDSDIADELLLWKALKSRGDETTLDNWKYGHEESVEMHDK